MRMFAGLDVGFKRTWICVVDETGKIVWRGVVDTHPEMIAAALHWWRGELAKVGLESGSMSACVARATRNSRRRFYARTSTRCSPATWRPARQSTRLHQGDHRL